LADEGIDTVHTYQSYQLGTFIEHATALGAGNLGLLGNAADNTLIGNNADNRLNGAAGNDTLIGGLGSDTLIGGVGNDIYVIRLPSKI
jgi:Ca2+-binding RTX toxin-like protein